MANVRLPFAIGNRSNTFQSRPVHLTTTDFFRLAPIFCKELAPWSNLKVNLTSQVRLAPLQKPFFGSAKVVNRAFWVPMRTLCEGWNDFITSSVHKGGAVLSRVGVISNDFLVEVFKSSSLIETSTQSRVDVVINSYNDGAAPSTLKGILTPKGKLLLKIFYGLGYKINFDNTLVSGTRRMANATWSKLPLLAFVRVYRDFYANSSWKTNLARFDEFLSGSIASDIVDLYSVESFRALCESLLYAYYNSDASFLYDAWSNPVSPNNFVSSTDSLRILDPTYSSNSVEPVTNGTPVIKRPAESPYSTLSSITQFNIDALTKLTQWMRRNQLSGYRPIERYLARFGVRLPDEKINRSVYLGAAATPVDIRDVMDTSMEGLGDYAGKGIGYGDGRFSCNSDGEYGYFLICSCLQPISDLVQGTPRYMQHLSLTDFYTPEFDGLGPQAIRRDEVVSGFGVHQLASNPPSEIAIDGIFGFAPRYYEYVTDQSNLSGDFVLNSKNAGLDSFYLTRMFAFGNTAQGADALGVNGNVTISEAFTRGNSDQYNRLFNDTSSSYDHFFEVFYFDIRLDAKRRPLYDDVVFDDAREGHGDARLQVGGAKF